MGLEEAVVSYVRVTQEETALNMPQESRIVAEGEFYRAGVLSWLWQEEKKHLKTELIIAKNHNLMYGYILT